MRGSGTALEDKFISGFKRLEERKSLNVNFTVKLWNTIENINVQIKVSSCASKPPNNHLLLKKGFEPKSTCENSQTTLECVWLFTNKVLSYQVQCAFSRIQEIAPLVLTEHTLSGITRPSDFVELTPT